MALKIERPAPRTAGTIAVEGAKKGVFSFVKFYFVVLPVTLLVAMAMAPLSSFLAVVVMVSGVGYAFRRPLGFTYRKIQEARAQRQHPPTPEAIEEAEAESEPQEETVRGAVLGREVETGNTLTIAPDIRERHLYLIGKSGTGKTTLIKNLITGDMQQGAGVAFVDPHGDAAGELLACIPPERIKDVIYFDPASEHAPAFNPFALPYPPEKLTEDIVSAFKMFFGESWGVRLEHLLRYGILTLLTDNSPHTLKDLQTFFLKPDYKAQVVSGHPEESIRDFWQYDPNANEKGAVSPILNKLSQLLLPRSPMERLFSKKENDLNFSDILNQQKILIVNLSKGMLGDAPAFLLGGLIVTGIQQAALARAAISEKERRDFFLYVDEFENYTISSFNSILAEARKYRLFLILANQNLGQIPKDLERNIFGNVATLVSFQVSAEDAATLKREMHRSRLAVRPKESTTTSSLSDFVEAQKILYREVLADKHLGMTHEEKRKVDRLRTKDAKRGTFEILRKGADSDFHLSQRRREIQNTLTTLERGELTPPLLRELFPDYEFRELTFPDVDDFTNLPPHHAIARISRAENVFPFRTFPPPSSDPECREEVLRLQSERARSRKETKPQPSSNGATPSAPPPAPQQPPKEEEDFRF